MDMPATCDTHKKRRVIRWIAFENGVPRQGRWPLTDIMRDHDPIDRNFFQPSQHSLLNTLFPNTPPMDKARR